MDAPGLATGKQGRFIPAPRLRVLERIRRAARYPITVIAAPAGYGKTVALRHYLQTLGGPVVRYDVRPSDSTLFGFVHGLARAFSAVAPDLQKTIMTAYESSRTSVDGASALAQWLYAHLEHFSGTVAIDDFHTTQSDTLAATFLTHVIDLTKDRIRWCISTRGIGTLPIASWIAYGDMDVPVDDRDLRMDDEEARAVANELAPELTAEEVAALIDVTKAWPTAFAFALRNSTRSGDLQFASAASRELLYAYLAEQVYRSLPEMRLDVLHFIARLEEIDLRILECAGYAEAEAILEELHASIGFVFRERPGVYRCHDLFRDFLNYQARLRGRHFMAGLLCRVARALEKGDELFAAIEAYAAVPSPADVLRLFQTHYGGLLDHASSDAIGIALKCMAPEVREREPVLLALLAVRELGAGKFARAEALLAKARANAVEAELFAELSIRLGGLIFDQGRDATTVLQPIVDDARLPDTFRMRALSFIAPRLVSRGEIDDASAALQRMRAYANAAGESVLTAQVLHRAGITALTLRAPREEMARLFEASAEMAIRHGAFVTAAAALGGASTVALYHDHDLSRAAAYAEQAIDAAMKAGKRLTIQTALLQLINVETWQGNAAHLELLQNRLAAIAPESPLAAYNIPAVAMMSAWRGDVGKAYEMLNSLGEDPSQDFDQCYNRALLALYAAGSRQPQRAIEIVESVVPQIERAACEHRYARLVCEMARAMCAIAAALGERISLAERILSRPPILHDRAVEAVRVCAKSVCNSVTAGARDESLLDGISMLDAAGFRGVGRLIEQSALPLLQGMREDSGLTRAEIEILAALAAGRSPKEIAYESGRSVHTVRTLSQRAIRKLGCSGRQQAIVAAHRRGIIPEPFGRPA